MQEGREYGGKHGGMVGVTMITASASEQIEMRTGREQASCASGSRFIKVHEEQEKAEQLKSERAGNTQELLNYIWGPHGPPEE